MASAIILALSGILVLFLLFTFLRQTLQNKLGIKICAVCAAVSLTWIALLAFRLLGFFADDLLVGILMGESIAGVMYLFEKKAKERQKENFLWLKVVIVLFGTALVYFYLAQRLSLVAVLTILFFCMAIVYFLLRSKWNKKSREGKKIALDKQGKLGKEMKKLEKKLEHCCD